MGSGGTKRSKKKLPDAPTLYPTHHGVSGTGTCGMNGSASGDRDEITLLDGGVGPVKEACTEAVHSDLEAQQQAESGWTGGWPSRLSECAGW